MHLARVALWTVLLFSAPLWAAQFREYYRGEPVTPRQDAPAPTTQPRVVPQPAPQPAIRRAQPPVAAPQPVRRTASRHAPAGYFGWGGNWLVRVSGGVVPQSRSVQVDTRNTGVPVRYTPDNTLMGTADGSTLTHKAEDLLFRFQAGVGYQLPNDGNFWMLDLYSAGDLQETLLSYAWTFPQHVFGGSIPYVKAIGGIGHVDAEGLAPTSFSLGIGAGAYNWLDTAKTWRLEYGLDLARREWLAIEHTYGSEEWIDIDWHLYLGAAWRF